jgi:predicted acylesterase/phospholipase RssA
MSAESDARAVIDGEDPSAADLESIADRLRDEGRTGLVGEMLTAVARRALQGGWRPTELADLAIDVLRDHQQFSYARRLLNRVRAGTDSERLRQQHALCTYKDLELPAGRRLTRALAILSEGGPIEDSTDAETLGIAGAIYKRRWEVGARRVDLESALFCYRRGYGQRQHPERFYAGVNAAFVADRIAALEDEAVGPPSATAEALREEAAELRREIVRDVAGGDGGWHDATLGEALVGLGRYDEACPHLAAVAARTKDLWRHETTAMQIAALVRLRGAGDDPAAWKALEAFVAGRTGAVRRAAIGKVGLALSGGGFRASLFHIGVLARLAECGVLRSVEVLSCVSGGSILGAFYYLKLRRLLEETPEEEVTDERYLQLVREVADEFLAGVRENLRGRLLRDGPDDLKMAFTGFSRTDRAGELYEELFYGPLRTTGDGPWRMPELTVHPHGRGEEFSLRYENWLREAKVPVLVLNATALNTGHSWQFTATWMGEPPTGVDERVDAGRRLRRVYYRDAPEEEDLQRPTLGKAVAASACVPGLFTPIRLARLYDDIDVELVDGGVHDNQGIASLVEQDCNVIIVSDASGQMADDEEPGRGFPKVLTRSNSVLMKRVRGAQYDELHDRVRSGTLRGLMTVHLTKGLPAPPRDWSRCQEPWTPEDDALSSTPARDYGFDEDAQHALAQLRTDLDAFSDAEAYALMAAGYRMTELDLVDALPDHASAPRRDDWPFLSTLATLTSARAGELTEELRSGRSRLLRGPKKWIHHRREDLDGLLHRRR